MKLKKIYIYNYVYTYCCEINIPKKDHTDSKKIENEQRNK